MSLRPPGDYAERYIDTAGGTTGGATAWPQLGGGGPDVLPVASRSTGFGTRVCSGVFFESAGNLVAKFPVALAGSSPATMTIPIPGPGWYEIAPATIDPSTTALPFTVWFSPLGPGAR